MPMTQHALSRAALLLAGVFLCAAHPAWSQSPEICKPYRPTVSSGWSNVEASWGASPEEVCSNVMSLSTNPRQVSEGLVYYTSRGALQNGPGGWYCVNYQEIFDSNGVLLPQYTGERNWDGVIGPVCSPLRIKLEGPSRTKALPAGWALPQTALVTNNGAPAPGKSVTITMSSGSTINGTTDAAGKLNFLYTPPYQKPATEMVTATCSECENTAQKTIDVEACEVCQNGK